MRSNSNDPWKNMCIHGSLQQDVAQLVMLSPGCLDAPPCQLWPRTASPTSHDLVSYVSESMGWMLWNTKEARPGGKRSLLPQLIYGRYKVHSITSGECRFSFISQALLSVSASSYWPDLRLFIHSFAFDSSTFTIKPLQTMRGVHHLTLLSLG